MDYIAKYLIDTSIKNCTCLPIRCVHPNTQNAQLLERHFMRKIPKDPRHKYPPNPICKGCNFTKNEIAKLGFEPRCLPRKTTTYWCPTCEIPLCVTPHVLKSITQLSSTNTITSKKITRGLNIFCLSL